MQQQFNDNMMTLFSGFPIKSIAVAVSGGADSMALLLLAKEWSETANATITALTVDHRLRPEAVEEALQVAAWCRSLGIKHHILTWETPSGKPAEARAARYELLASWCKANQTPYLFTAHHMGDQAETLFFRLARGSTLRGLACMPIISDMHGLKLVRPLLGLRKAELVDYLKSKNQKWIEDPSNQNTAYTRNAIRAQMQALSNYEDVVARAGKVAEFFGRFRAALDEKVESALNDCVRQTQETLLLDAEAYRKLPPEIALLLLARLIQLINHDEHPPRTEKLERLQQWLMAPQKAPATLAHLSFQYQQQNHCFLIAKTA